MLEALKLHWGGNDGWLSKKLPRQYHGCHKHRQGWKPTSVKSLRLLPWSLQSRAERYSQSIWTHYWYREFAVDAVEKLKQTDAGKIVSKNMKCLALLVVAFCAVGTATAANFDGEWTGNMTCGPLVTKPIESPAFTSPVSMKITGKAVKLIRDTAKVVESSTGVLATNSVTLTGDGHFKDGSGKPWGIKFSGKFLGSKFSGDGEIFSSEDGFKFRECSVSLTLSGESAGAVAPSLSIPKAESVSPVSQAADKNNIEQQLVKAAMGRLQQGFNSTCKKRQGKDGQMLAIDESCEINALMQAIANDEDQSIIAVNNIVANTRVAVGQSKREDINNTYYQCHHQGLEWSQYIMRAVSSMAIRGETPEYSSSRIKSTLDAIKKQCSPQEAQSFMNVVSALARTLDPIRSARQKEVENLKAALSEKIRVAKDEERIEKELALRKKQELEINQASEIKKREDERKEKARIAAEAEAERMKDPVYKAEADRRQMIDREKRNCEHVVSENVRSCYLSNAGNKYASEACGNAYQSSVQVCWDAYRKCLSDSKCDKNGYQMETVKGFEAKSGNLLNQGLRR